MRRFLPALIAVAVLGAFALTLGFLFWKSRDAPETFEIATPITTDIVAKTVATGAIVPRVEVDIKARVSGVIEHIALEPGAEVERGALIAEIQVIPDSASLSRARSALDQAKVRMETAQRARERAESLAESAAIADVELESARADAQLAERAHQAAAEDLRVVREGAARRSDNVSTQVRSTVEGTVLDVPVKVGESVIESNTFNAGTTIATVADMSDMIFEGDVDESEVGKIGEGMPLDISIGAVQGRSFAGTLEYISPKGRMEQGAVQFEIKAALTAQEDVFVRAGSSANADIVLDSREQALAIDERLLQFREDGSVYVEVEVSEDRFEERSIEVGLSDGIHIEVISGLDEATRIKVPPSGG